MKSDQQYKKIGKGDIKGDQGVAFIHLQAANMGFLWKAHGAPEAGIDGHIELRNDITDEVHNVHILVQSKAGNSYFKTENERMFEFVCDERDLNYWMSGTAPVILVVSRDGVEGYWMSVKDYFKDPRQRASRRITFDKTRDRFDSSARQRLIDLGEPPDAGLYMDAIPKSETLFTNIVPLQILPSYVFFASTNANSEAEFERRVPSRYRGPRSWVVYDGNLTSFIDPRSLEMGGAIELDSVERWSVTEVTNAPDLHGRFIHLLAKCLREHLADFDIAFHHRRELYYFRPARRPNPRVFSYRSVRESTSREVTMWRGSEGGRSKPFCRHCAAEMSFRCYDGAWFVEVEPTYVFTTDGYHTHPSARNLLSGIKRLEKNRAVLGQMLMWSDLLSVDQALLDDGSVPLKFGKALTVEASSGIWEADWLPPKREREDVPVESGQAGLF